MKSKSAFTLLEMLVASVLLACLIIFLARVFMGIDKFSSQHQSQLQSSKTSFNALASLRREIESSILRYNTTSRRNLNMRAFEDETGIYLYFCRFNDLATQSDASHFIEYISYFWDKQNLYRASFTDTYQTNSDPYAWISSSSMQSALQQAKNQSPLISELKSFKLTFFNEDGASSLNQWNDFTRLPQSVQIDIENPQAFSANILCRHYGVTNALDY